MKIEKKSQSVLKALHDGWEIKLDDSCKPYTYIEPFTGKTRILMEIDDTMLNKSE